MKHAAGREVRFAGHRNAGFAAASRRLNPTHRWGLRSHPSLRDGVWGWVAETGLERPAYPQMPLRGNENVQTPLKAKAFRPSREGTITKPLLLIPLLAHDGKVTHVIYQFFDLLFVFFVKE